jgi:hypothetical protein
MTKQVGWAWRAFFALVVIAPGIAADESNEAIAYGSATKLADLQNNEIVESSGLAISRIDANRFWTHNDSGDTARLFAFDRQGRHLGTSGIVGAGAEDWEDMASAVIDGKPMLIVGDIGGNGKKRKKYTVYIVPEPEPKKDTKVWRQLDFHFDRPIDCEALAFDPSSQMLIFIEKNIGLASAVYSLPIGQTQAIQSARRIGTISTFPPPATAADISADGRRLIVTTYVNNYLYQRENNESWADRLRRPGVQLDAAVPRAQGEAACFGSDNVTLYFTSEKRPTPFFQLRPVEKSK